MAGVWFCFSEFRCMVERLSRHCRRFMHSVTYFLYQQLCPAKFSILILMYFLFQKLRYFSQSCCVWEIQSCQRTWILWEGERGESYGAVWFGSHISSCKVICHLCLHHGSMESEWQAFWEMTRGPFVDLFSKSWYWSFIIVICLLTESMLIFFFNS